MGMGKARLPPRPESGNEGPGSVATVSTATRPGHTACDLSKGLMIGNENPSNHADCGNLAAPHAGATASSNELFLGLRGAGRGGFRSGRRQWGGRSVQPDDHRRRSPPNAPLGANLPRELEIRDALAEIGRIMNASLQLEDVYFEFARQVTRLLPYDRLSIASIDRHAWTYRFEYIVGETMDGWPLGETFALDGTTKERAITIASPVRISTRDLKTVAAPSTDIAGLIDAGLESMVVVPLQWRQHAVGLLSLCSKDPGAYEQEEIEIAERVAAQISGAVANARLREDLQREPAIADTLTELGHVISSSTNFSEVFQQFASVVRRLIPHDRLALGSLDPVRSRFTRLLAAGSEVPGYSFGVSESLGPGVAAALQRRASITMSAGGTYPEFGVHRYEDPGTRAGLESTLLVPLIAGNRAIGVLWFRSEEPDLYGIQHRNLATRIGRLIAGHVADAALSAKIA